MKTVGGRLKLDANERRVGNFVVREEDAHMKVMDINGRVSARVHKVLPMGSVLSMAYDDAGSDGFLRNYIPYVYLALTLVPDEEFLRAFRDISYACLDRNKEAYGLREVTDEEDAGIIENERELHDALEDMRGGGEARGDGDS